MVFLLSMHLCESRVLMQIFFNLLVIFADIKMSCVVVTGMLMEISTSEVECFKVSNGCLILGQVI